jgi:hypothetical protein
VNRADGTKELEAPRRFVQRGGPYGSELCSEQIFALLGLESLLRGRGHPRKPLRSPKNDNRPLLFTNATKKKFCQFTSMLRLVAA